MGNSDTKMKPRHMNTMFALERMRTTIVMFS